MCNWLCSMSQPRTDLQAFCMNHKHNKVTEQTKDPNISKTFFFVLLHTCNKQVVSFFPKWTNNDQMLAFMRKLLRTRTVRLISIYLYYWYPMIHFWSHYQKSRGGGGHQINTIDYWIMSNAGHCDPSSWGRCMLFYSSNTKLWIHGIHPQHPTLSPSITHSVPV